MRKDKLFNQANKMLSIVGKGKIASKADILKTLGPELRGVNQMTDAVQKARRFLRSTGVVENKEPKLVLDLAVEMTQDTLLIMHAINLQQAASSNATRTQAKMRESLERVSRRLLIIDSEITRALERVEKNTRTA